MSKRTRERAADRPGVPGLEAFERRAWMMYRQIPERYRRGVDGVAVRPETVPHPELPQVFTLGECRTEDWPSAYGGPGDVHSMVVLYHGSFRALAEREPEFDWEAELWETLTHELKHHLESLANEDALERLDYAEDHNYARAAGEPFDPLFYRMGAQAGRHTWRVGDDWFVEVPWDPAQAARGRARVAWRGREREVEVPAPAARVTFVRLEPDAAGPGDVYAVLRLRRPPWAVVRDWIRGRRPPAVAEHDVADGGGGGGGEGKPGP